MGSAKSNFGGGHATRREASERKYVWFAGIPVCRLCKATALRLSEANIRNTVVFASAVKEFERFGYIELIDRRFGIPAGLPDFLVRTIKRSKHHSIWIPGPCFPDEPWDLFDLMKPSMRGKDVVWQHIPPGKPNTWRRRRPVH
jgi:hypothetical protein